MVDTGGTLANAVMALKDRGANQVFAGATHALLSGAAVEKLSAAPLEEFVVTNTISCCRGPTFRGPEDTVGGGVVCESHRMCSRQQIGQQAFRADSGGLGV